MTVVSVRKNSIFIVKTIQNSALSKQSPAVSTICRILTIEVDGKLGKVKGIKSYLQCVEGAGPEVKEYILYYI